MQQPVAFVFAVAFAGAVAFSFAFLDENGKHRLAQWLVTLALPVAWIVLLLLLPWEDISDQKRGLFLFLGVFPLINALFDTVSYAVTLTLLRLGLRGRWPFLYGAMDLVIAMGLFLALGATLTLLITGMNALTGTPLFDLGALFAGIRETPADYWWLYIMMFSTLLPTVAHMALAVLSLQSVFPLWLRRPVANWLKASPDHSLEATAAQFLVGAVWTAPFLVVGAAVYWGWGYVGGWVEMVGWMYLDTLESLMLAF